MKNEIPSLTCSMKMLFFLTVKVIFCDVIGYYVGEALYSSKEVLKYSTSVNRQGCFI